MGKGVEKVEIFLPIHPISSRILKTTFELSLGFFALPPLPSTKANKWTILYLPCFSAISTGRYKFPEKSFPRVQRFGGWRSLARIHLATWTFPADEAAQRGVRERELGISTSIRGCWSKIFSKMKMGKVEWKDTFFHKIGSIFLQSLDSNIQSVGFLAFF